MNNMFFEEPDLLVLTGSHLYGYATPESDEDLLGFVIPPLKTEISIVNRFEQKIPTKQEMEQGKDCKIYSLKKFLNQLMRNDTQCLELLFAPKSHIKICSEFGQVVINNRNLFVSKHLYKRFAGYAYSEFRKVRGVAAVPEKRTPNEEEVIDQLRNLFRPDKKRMDEILDLLYADRPKKEISVYRKLGEARKQSIDKYGYSVKNAAHCIRLLMEGTEILTTGEIKFPLSNEKINTLRKIRTGEMNFEDVEELYSFWDKTLNEAADNSNLPQKVDQNRVNDLFFDLTSAHFQEIMPPKHLF